MRKTVIDGSNTSGFQRTVLIAYDGYIETSQGRVGIESIALEEDSARPVCRGEEKDVYKLDRLGIPLIEIATAPEAKNPEQVKEAALKIGEVLRSCKVKRGIGTIRQDVNLSISGHPRVEIKGFQEAKMFLEATENEMKRQKENLDLCKDGRKEKIKPEVRNVILEDNEEKGEKRGNTKFLRPMPGEARMYPETDLPLLKVSRGYINEIKKNLPKLRSEVEEELKNKGLSQDMIKILFKTESLEEFKSLLNVLDMPVLVGKVLLTYPKEIAGKNKVSEEEVKEKLTLDIMEFVLNAFKEEKINQDQIKQVLERIYSGEKPGEAIKFDSLDTNQIEEFIMNLIKEKPGLNANAYMGLVMKEFKGQVSGKEAMELINKHLNQ